jgi:SAM-dependent methyltransferase
MVKPYAKSCDRNRDPILEVIKPLLADKQAVLEIGSGTGQHAVYFAGNMPHLVWHASDRAQNHEGISRWLGDAGLPNVLGPIELDVQHDWPALKVDVVYSANTAHIMHWDDVLAFFAGVGHLLQPGGLFLLYGPFSFSGVHVSDSNAEFDLRLKEKDPLMGVRDFDDLDVLAREGALEFMQDYAMPANNRILLWRKR